MIHPTASIDPTARLGVGTSVWACANILAGVTIGARCSIGACAEIGRDSMIGDDVRIGHGAFLPPRSVVEDRAFIGPGVIACDDRRPRVNNPDYLSEPPTIESDAAIGAGVILLPGIRIGHGALVGGGSVVVRDVAPGAVVFGNPARPAPLTP